MSYYVNPHGHQCPWYPYSELLGYPSANWCEEVSCYWISQPVSTYAALSFIVVASILFGSLRKKNHPDLKLLLNLLLLTGVGTAVYHVTLNYAAQLLAHGLIYTFFGVVILKNMIRQARFGYSQRNKYLFMYVAFMLLAEHILYTQFLATQVLVPINFLLAIITEARCKKFESLKIDYKFIVLGFLLLLVAEASSMMDLFRIHCNPKSAIFHGRALWHILSAISFGFMYMHQFQHYPLKDGFGEDEDEEEREEQTQADELSVVSDLDSNEDVIIEASYSDVEEDEEIEAEEVEIDEPKFDSMLDLQEEPEIDDSEEEEEIEDSTEDNDDQTQMSFEDVQEDDNHKDDAEDELPTPGVYASEEMPTQFGALEDEESDDEDDKKE